MSKIKIVHLAQCAGGVDVYLRMLLANLDKERFENILVCSQEFNACDYDGIAQVIQINMVNALSPSKDGAAVKAVRSLLKKLKPDILYCHSSKAGGIGRLAAIGLHIPTVYNPHGWAFCMNGSKAKTKIYLWMERVLSLLTDQIVTISNYEKLVAVEKHVAPSKKLKTIFNGIDVAGVRKQAAQSTICRKSLNIPDDAWVVGMVGRISRQKAPDVFVEMAAKVKAIIPNAWFIIVGNGDERKKIESLIDERGLKDCFTITGWTATPQSYAQLFDQAVLLSRWEGFGLVLAEYMALGKPIVATKTNAIPDLITDHDNGILIPVDDPEKAAKNIVDLYHDKGLREEMSKKGKMRVEAFFDANRTAKENEYLFLELLGHND